VYVTAVAGVTLPSPLWGTYQARWDLTLGAVSGLYVLYPLGVLLVLLAAGHWTDSLGRVLVLRLGLACSALSAAAFLVAESPWLVAVARVLTGLASGFVVAASNALLVELAAPESRRAASVWSTVLNQVGLGAGALAAALLARYAWSPTHLVFALHLVLCLAGLGASLSLPETAPGPPGRASWRLQRLAVPVERLRSFWSASLMAFAAFALCGLLAALAPAIVNATLGTSSVLAAGGSVALIFMVSAVSQLFWARRSDGTCLVVGAALLLASLSGIVAALAAGSTAGFLASVGVGGAAVGALFMGTLSIVNAAAEDDRRGRITATYFTVTFAGLVLPVLVTGLAADHLSTTRAVAVFAVLVGAVTVTAAALRLPEVVRSPAE
jgi:MFS family permease